MSDSSEFWADKDDWPGNPPGYVFLARAVHEVGRKLLPEEWTGDEPLKYEDREWDRGPYKDEAARGRFKKVIEAVSTLCATGQLASAVMTSSRGTLSQIDTDWWASASRKVIEGWFLLCRINLSAPVTKVPDLFDREPLGPIFVSKADFDRYFGGSASSEGPTIYHTGLSGRPTAIKLILPEAQRRISAGNYPGTQEEFAEALSSWLRTAHKEAPSATAKAITNNEDFKKLWRSRNNR